MLDLRVEKSALLTIYFAAQVSKGGSVLTKRWTGSLLMFLIITQSSAHLTCSQAEQQTHATVIQG